MYLEGVFSEGGLHILMLWPPGAQRRAEILGQGDS
jgi:hypothetical protein